MWKWIEKWSIIRRKKPKELMRAKEKRIRENNMKVHIAIHSVHSTVQILFCSISLLFSQSYSHKYKISNFVYHKQCKFHEWIKW